MTSEASTGRLVLPVGVRDHVQGPATAPVTLVEYGDYECPYCGAAYPVVKEVQARLGERLRFIFRNFPLGQAHPHAEHAAEAAEAAAAQGRFWPMHDFLFEHQQALADNDLLRYAAALGLDTAAFARDGGARVCRTGARGLSERRAQWCERYAHLLHQRHPPRRLIRRRHAACRHRARRACSVCRGGLSCAAEPAEPSVSAEESGVAGMSSHSRNLVPRWLLARLATTLVAWLAAFLVVLTVLVLFGDRLAALPLAVRALVISGVVVAIMANLTMPLLGRAVTRWLAGSPR